MPYSNMAVKTDGNMWENLRGDYRSVITVRQNVGTNDMRAHVSEMIGYLKGKVGSLSPDLIRELGDCATDDGSSQLGHWFENVKSTYSADVQDKQACSMNSPAAKKGTVTNGGVSEQGQKQDFMNALYDDARKDCECLGTQVSYLFDLNNFYLRIFWALLLVLIVLYLGYELSHISSALNIELVTAGLSFRVLGDGFVDQGDHLDTAVYDRKQLVDTMDDLTVLAFRVNRQGFTNTTAMDETVCEVEKLADQVSTLERRFVSQGSNIRENEGVIDIPHTSPGDGPKHTNPISLVHSRVSASDSVTAFTPSGLPSRRTLPFKRLLAMDRRRFSRPTQANDSFEIASLKAMIKALTVRLERVEEERRLEAVRVEDERRLNAARMEAEHGEAMRQYKQRVQVVVAAIGGIIVFGMVGPAVAPYVIPVGSVAASCIFSGPWYDAGVTMSRTLNLILDLSFIRHATNTMHFIWQNHESFI